MKKTLHFSVAINAPRRLVWETMLDPEGYREWTSAFMEGSYFSGSWEQGQAIQFRAPNGDGMASVIEENQRYEHVSIRHIGEIVAGVTDTSSDKVLAWAPAYEKYYFSDFGSATEVKVALDTVAEWENFMLETFPKSLQLLKALCERKAQC